MLDRAESLVEITIAADDAVYPLLKQLRSSLVPVSIQVRDIFWDGSPESSYNPLPYQPGNQGSSFYESCGSSHTDGGGFGRFGFFPLLEEGNRRDRSGDRQHSTDHDPDDHEEFDRKGNQRSQDGSIPHPRFPRRKKERQGQ